MQLAHALVDDAEDGDARFDQVGDVAALLAAEGTVVAWVDHVGRVDDLVDAGAGVGLGVKDDRRQPGEDRAGVWQSVTADTDPPVATSSEIEPTVWPGVSMTVSPGATWSPSRTSRTRSRSRIALVYFGVAQSFG